MGSREVEWRRSLTSLKRMVSAKRTHVIFCDVGEAKNRPRNTTLLVHEEANVTSGEE